MSKLIEKKNEHISVAKTDESVDTLNVASEVMVSFWIDAHTPRTVFWTFQTMRLSNLIFNIREITEIEKEVFIMGTPQTGCL